MTNVIGWLWMVFVLIGCLTLSLVMRRGRSAKAKRVFLNLYTREDLPGIVRNTWSYMPILVAGLVPLLVGIFILSDPPRGFSLSKTEAEIVGLGALSYCLCFVGLILVVGSQPPHRLVPGWVRSDERLARYNIRNLGRMDKAIRAAGMVLGAAGVAVAAILLASLGR